MSKRDKIPHTPDDEARLERLRIKEERNLRRRTQDKKKGSRHAEEKLKALSNENNVLRRRIEDVSKLIRALVKMLPPDLKVEYEKLRTAINQGDFEDVHPDA